MRKKTTAEFIEQAKAIHGYRYDYSMVEYQGRHKKVVIICPDHGQFKQEAGAHLRGQNCPQCMGMRKIDTSVFIKEATRVHEGFYDYSLVEYRNWDASVSIICPDHGRFEQRAGGHLSGKQCMECSKINRGKKRMHHSADFFKNCKLVHEGKYQYDELSYTGCHGDITINCPSHGWFRQSANNHKRGQGCPSCNQSTGEKKVARFLDQSGIIYENEYTFDGCRNKKSLPFDFFLLNWRICIEYQGKQHYETTHNNFFGGEESLKSRQKNDQIKRDFCKKSGIILVEIPYNDERIAQRILGAIAQRKREREQNPIQEQMISRDWGSDWVFGEQARLF